MAIISSYSSQKKIDYFLKDIPKEARILEVGAGTGWAGKYLKQNGWKHYTSFDLVPPSDIVGNIKDWKKLNVPATSFDFILAFEVVEHGDFFKEFHELIKPGGKLFLSTPVPSMDWFLKILEVLNLNQKRTSPHSHLRDIREIPYFKTIEYKKILGLAQWGMYTPK